MHLEERTVELDRTIEEFQREIKQRKQAEKRLYKAEERLRALSACSPFGIITADLRGRWTYINLRCQEICGCEGSEVLGYGWSQLIHPNDRDWVIAEWFECATLGWECFQEYRLVTPQGDPRWVQVRTSPTFSKIGELTGYVGTIEDVTSRKNAKEALWQTEQLLQAILDRSPSPIYVKDIEGRYLLVNQKVQEFFGREVEEIIGKTDYDLFPPEVADNFRANDTEAIAQGKAIEAEEVVIKDDEVYTYLAIKFPLFDAKGIPYALCGISTDITARKTLEQKLVKRQTIFDAFFQAAPVGLCILDEQQRYVQINEALATIDGLSVEEHLGKTIKEIVPDLAPVLEPMCEKILRTGESFPNLQLSGKTEKEPDVTKHWVGTHFPLLGEDGKPIGVGSVVIDISDRKIAEEALRQSEQRYRSLVLASSQIVWTTDAQGWGSEAPEWRAYTGQTQEEVKSWGWLNAIHPMDCDRAAQLWTQAVETKSLYETEYRLRGVDGSYRYFNARGVPVLAEDGSIREWVGICIDIHDRFRAEEALRESEARYRSLILATSQIVWITNAQGQVIDAPGWAAYTGQTESEVKGWGWLDAVHPTDRDRAAQIWAHAVETKTLYETEYRMRAADGSYRYFHARGVPVLTENGSIREWVGICIDIHDRFQAEEERTKLIVSLQESQRDYMANFEQAAVGIALAELDGKFLRINQKLCDIVGYTHDELIQLSFPDITHPDDVQREAEMLSKLILGEVSHLQYEKRYIRKNGSIIWVNLTVSAVRDLSGELEYLIGVIEDISDRKQAQEELRNKAAELELTLYELQQTQAHLIQSEKMSSLGQLVAGVAHEINNPVNFIHGNITHVNQYTKDLLNLIEIYQECYPHPVREIQEEIEAIELDFLKEDLPKVLSSMKIGTDRIRQIVLSLRNFSRLDEAEMKEVDIHEGIDSTLLILHNRIKKSVDRPAISVIKEYGNLPLIECYPGQLNQVFMNILTNAIDAIDEKYKSLKPEQNEAQPLTIKISTSLQPNKRVVISIADSGPGIPNSVKARLFDPFFTTKPIGKGTGLGLAISYSIIVEKHSGKLHCKTQPGQGTEFVIEIPARKA